LARTLAGVAWFVFFFTHYGDPAPKPGMVVDNRTDVVLNIYVVVVGQEPVLQAVVPPRSRLATGVVCGRTEMRATAGGHLVARRGPFPTCDESEWIISSADPVASPPSGWDASPSTKRPRERERATQPLKRCTGLRQLNNRSLARVQIRRISRPIACPVLETSTREAPAGQTPGTPPEVQAVLAAAWAVLVVLLLLGLRSWQRRWVKVLLVALAAGIVAVLMAAVAALSM
jgi:hypothetical protein